MEKPYVMNRIFMSSNASVRHCRSLQRGGKEGHPVLVGARAVSRVIGVDSGDVGTDSQWCGSPVTR